MRGQKAAGGPEIEAGAFRTGGGLPVPSGSRSLLSGIGSAFPNHCLKACHGELWEYERQTPSRLRSRVQRRNGCCCAPAKRSQQFLRRQGALLLGVSMGALTEEELAAGAITGVTDSLGPTTIVRGDPREGAQWKWTSCCSIGHRPCASIF